MNMSILFVCVCIVCMRLCVCVRVCVHVGVEIKYIKKKLAEGVSLEEFHGQVVKYTIHLL